MVTYFYYYKAPIKIVDCNLALYISTLLDIRIFKRFHKSLLLHIAVRLKFINKYSKSLILSQYYKYFALYVKCSPRKLKWVNKMDAQQNNLNDENRKYFKLKKKDMYNSPIRKM